MADPLVSTIIIVYNGERFLAEAIDSALAQDYPNFEVIVVDDGSTDGSGEIAQSRPVRYIWQENKGEVGARNTGVAAAQGEYIAFLDADDVWLPNKLSLQVASLEENPDVDIGLAWAQDFREGDAPLPGWFKEEWLESPQQAFLPSVWLLRRSVFDRIGLFDVQFTHACDVEFLARARFHNLKLHVLPDLVAWRRIHGNNMIFDGSNPRMLMKVLRASAARHKDAERNRAD